MYDQHALSCDALVQILTVATALLCVLYTCHLTGCPLAHFKCVVGIKGSQQSILKRIKEINIQMVKINKYINTYIPTYIHKLKLKLNHSLSGQRQPQTMFCFCLFFKHFGSLCGIELLGKETTKSQGRVVSKQTDRA